MTGEPGFDTRRDPGILPAIDNGPAIRKEEAARMFERPRFI